MTEDQADQVIELLRDILNQLGRMSDLQLDAIVTKVEEIADCVAPPTLPEAD